MKFYVLGHESYDDPGKNYGDCTVIVHNREAVIYDCGSVEHAQVAISILDRERVLQATVILSHNDSDHFNGIQYLIDRNRVSKLFTVLLLKYKKKILDAIDDGRRNVHSIGEAIKEKYSNIASLRGQVPLKDVF